MVGEAINSLFSLLHKQLQKFIAKFLAGRNGDPARSPVVLESSAGAAR